MGKEKRNVGLSYIAATVCPDQHLSLCFSPRQLYHEQLSCPFPTVKENHLVLLALERKPLTNLVLLIDFILWGKKKKKVIKLASWPAAVERK